MSEKITTEVFIEKLKSIYGDKFDYSHVEYINQKTKIKLLCKKHNQIFEEIPRKLLDAKTIGCVLCEEEYKEIQRMQEAERFIKEAKEIHGDKYDYSLVSTTFKNRITKVEIICNQCDNHFFVQPTYHIHDRRGCPKCASKLLGQKLSKTKLHTDNPTEEFIRRAKLIHGDKYDYSKVNYINLNTKVEIFCNKHQKSFFQKPDNHLKGEGCSDCGKETARVKISIANRCSTEEFIEKARKVHGDKYDYSLVNYVRNNIPVKIICPIDGVFEQRPDLHLRGSGCQLCAKRKITMTTEEFIRRAKEVHGDKYDYSKTVYINSSIPVEIICPVHGSIFVLPYSHLHGYECKYCSQEKSRYTFEQFIEDAINFYGDKYDYSKVVFKGYREKIEIVCPTHGPFFTKIYPFLKGQGCPSCKDILSKGENKIREWLENYNIQFSVYQKFEGLKDTRALNTDLFLPNYGLAIEYQGIQHYKPVQFNGTTQEDAEKMFEYTLKHDDIKKEYFKNSTLNLLNICYKDYNIIENILDKVIFEKDFDFLKSTSSEIF